MMRKEYVLDMPVCIVTTLPWSGTQHLLCPLVLAIWPPTWQLNVSRVLPITILHSDWTNFDSTSNNVCLPGFFERIQTRSVIFLTDVDVMCVSSEKAGRQGSNSQTTIQKSIHWTVKGFRCAPPDPRSFLTTSSSNLLQRSFRCWQ